MSDIHLFFLIKIRIKKMFLSIKNLNLTKPQKILGGTSLDPFFKRDRLSVALYATE